MNPDYIAGFFDGEGFATLRVTLQDREGGHRIYVTPRLGFTQSSSRAEVIEAIQRYLGLGHIRRNNSGIIHLTIDRREDVKRLVELMKDRVTVKRETLLIVKEAIQILDHANGHIDCQQLKALMQLRTKLLNYMPLRARKRAEKGHIQTLHRFEFSGLSRYYDQRSQVPAMIKNYRCEYGLSQDAFGRLVGIPRSTIEHYEKEGRIPRFPRAMRILRFIEEHQGRPEYPRPKSCEPRQFI
jgi:DNA-binding XRE family transcriptional regulator